MTAMDMMNGTGAGGGEHMAHDKYHGSVERLPNGGYHYTHGAFLGHVVPGSFFIVWGSWWALSLFHSFISSRMQRRPFRSRAWFALPAGPAWLRRAPLEPALKVLLPSIGALGEIWLGHESWRSLYASDGRFYVDNLNDWQHSLMYLCFILSGGVDLLGHYAGLPSAMEHVFLGLAFLGELLLLAFHLKGPAIEVELHLILALQVGATVLSVLGEALAPSSLVAACMRPYWTIVQGVWWIQTAFAMFVNDPAFDPDYMGGEMMVPAVFVLHMLWVAFAMLCVLLGMRALALRLHGPGSVPWELPGGGGGGGPPLAQLPGSEEAADAAERSLEMGGISLKHHGSDTGAW